MTASQMKLLAAFVLLLLVAVAGTWGTYLAAKWVASLLVASQFDQVIMGVLGVVVVIVVVFGVLALALLLLAGG
jgi:hypothetical protein